MKYKTFRGVLLAGGVIAALGACGGLGLWCRSIAKDDSGRRGPVASQPTPVIVTSPPIQTSQAPGLAQGPVTPPAPNAPNASNATAPLSASERSKGIPLRPMDLEILARAAGSISGDKVKDAIGGRSYKVNLYQDAGEARVNRLKIDLDRDDKWDEKWTLSPARDDIRRQVSVADDDKTYDEEYRLRGDMWLRK